MVRIPKFQSQVSPVTANIPEPNVTTRPPREAFGEGVARAEGGTSKVFDQIAKVFGDRADQVRKLEKRKFQSDFNVKFSTDVQDRLFSDKKKTVIKNGQKMEINDGILTRTFEDADGATFEYDDWYNDRKNQALSDIDDPELRQKISEDMDRQYLNNRRGVIQHEIRQVNSARERSFDSDVKTMEESFASIVNPDDLKGNITALKEKNKILHDQQNLDKKASALNTEESVSKALGNSITSSLLLDPTGANASQILELAKKELSSKSFNTLKRLVDNQKKQAAKIKTNEIDGAIIDGTATPEMILESADVIGNATAKKKLNELKKIQESKFNLIDFSNKEIAEDYLNTIDLIVSDIGEQVNRREIVLDMVVDGKMTREEGKALDDLNAELRGDEQKRSLWQNAVEASKAAWNFINPTSRGIMKHFMGLVTATDVEGANEELLRQEYNNEFPEAPLSKDQKVVDPNRPRNIVFKPLSDFFRLQSDKVKREIELLKSFGTGAVSTIEGSASALEALGKSGKFGNLSLLGADIDGKTIAENIGSSISRKARDIREDTLAVEDSNFTDQVAAGFGSMSTFFIPGLGIAKGLQIANFAPRASVWLGIGASSVLESMVEGGSAYKRSIESGVPEKQANDVGSAVFWSNLPLLTVTNRVGIFGDSGKVIERLLKTGSVEGMQELSQEVIGNIVSNDPILKNGLNAFSVGAIVGGGTSVLTQDAVESLGELETGQQLLDDFTAKLQQERGEVDIGSSESEGVTPENEASSVISFVNKDGKKVFTKLTKDELSFLEDEVANIPEAVGDESQIHLDAVTPNLIEQGTEVSRDEFIEGHSQAKDVFDNIDVSGIESQIDEGVDGGEDRLLIEDITSKELAEGSIEGEGFFVKESQGRVESDDTRKRRILRLQKKQAEKAQLKLQIKEAKQSVQEKERLRAEKKIDKIKTSKEIVERRRNRVRAIRDFFGLTDNDLKSISKKDIRLMDNFEFKRFIDDLEAKASSLSKTRQLKNQVNQLIIDKELIKVDNLRLAMKFPPIEKMNDQQLESFENAIIPFQQGDEFLSLRRLQTVDNTDLSGVKTVREAKERMADKIGVDVKNFDNIRVSPLDKFLFDTALARRNDFYKFLVDETNSSLLDGEQRFLEMEREVDDLVKKARNSKKRKLVDRLIPTDEIIFEWLESPIKDEFNLLSEEEQQGLRTKEEVSQEMTDEELDLASYLQSRFAQYRDYLVEHNTLKNYQRDYITHIRRGFLETWKEDGLLNAFKEVYNQYQEDEAVFKILEDDTENILPLEKFFQFAMKRTGKLRPSKNVAKAFKAYTSAFMKKQSLDKIVPALDIYAHILSPKEVTPEGLKMDRRLTKFVKEWVNNKKGRRNSLGGILPQNGVVDMGLRGLNSFVSLIDLGLNIPVGATVSIGEQVTTFINLGSKQYALGLKRMKTKKGKKVISDNESFVGKSPWRELQNTANDIGDTFNTGLYSMFDQSSILANQIHLLGSLTKEEWANGEISKDRTAQLKRDVGRMRNVQGSKSIFGATSAGSTLTKYKTWALPVLNTVIDDISIVSSMLRRGEFKDVTSKREFQELLRATLTTALIVLAGRGLVKDDDESMFGKIVSKAYRESLTILGAIDPTVLSSIRLSGFLEDLSISLKQIVTLEEYKTKRGLKGVSKGIRTLTPGAVRQFLPKDKKRKSTGRKKSGRRTTGRNR